jgi:outer membrane protein, heavy metal efflux system
MLTRIFMVGAAALLPLCVHAQSFRPLALAEAIDLAIAAHPGLRAARLGVAAAAAETSQAGVLPNPELTLLQEGTERGTRSRTVQISQRLELGGKRAARVGLADGDRRVAAQDLAVAEAELRADVTAAYFETLIAQQRLELAEASLQLARKATDAATRRVAAGRISPIEQSRSQVARAAVQLEVAQAVTGLELARSRLAAYWAEPPTRPLAGVLEAPPLPPLETLLRRLNDAPRLRRALSQVERDDARVRLERSRRVPDVSVILGNKRDDEIGRHQAVFGVSVPLPLFDRNAGAELGARHGADKARAELDGERIRLAQALTAAYRRAELAQAEVHTLRNDILPAAQGAHDAAVTGFELGKFGFLDVMDAQRTLLQIRTQYLAALSERYRAAADIERCLPLAAAPTGNTP